MECELDGRSVGFLSSSYEKHIPLRNKALVSLCDATHCKSASALQTRFEAAAVNCDGLSSV